MTERDLNPWTEWVIQVPTITNARIFLGFVSAVAAPVSSADYLANLSGVGFHFDTGVHATNIAIAQNSGGASSDRTTLSNVGTMTTGVLTFALRADNANTKFQYSFNGGAWGDINTAIPAATTALSWQWFCETLSGAHNFDIYRVKTLQDN